MRILSLMFVSILMITISTTPASAQLFLCEKTNDAGEVVSPDSPQYDDLEYDNQIVYLIQPLMNLLLAGVFVLGILGAIYSTIKDALYTPEADDDAAYYVKMRARLLIGAVFVPLLTIILSLIVEFFTKYENTCLIDLPF